jgi:hydroxymethylpyrimidine pyrophosphatase-like HAD family hydrolase
VRALEHLHAHGVPVVLVSGRSRPRLEAVATMLGAADVLPELGATDAG